MRSVHPSELFLAVEICGLPRAALERAVLVQTLLLSDVADALGVVLPELAEGEQPSTAELDELLLTAVRELVADRDRWKEKAASAAACADSLVDHAVNKVGSIKL